MASRLQPAVVLVADRTLSGRYRALFEGIFGTMQTTSVPEFLMRRLLSPPQPTDEAGRALAAVVGLRRVESALLASGFGRDDVVCTTPERLPDLIGPWTKIVGFSSSDPLGLAMSNSTTVHFCGGRLYSAAWTERLLMGLAEPKRRHGFRIVAGGGGAWQRRQNLRRAQELGVDVIFEGFFEGQGPGLFRDIIEGKAFAPHVIESQPLAGLARPIAGASSMGVIELSRGCGKGCEFCTSGHRPMEHVPADVILHDLQTNVSAGITAVVSGSEDFFRYGSSGQRVDFEALAGLLEEMRQVRGLSFMQIDHANISSVLQLGLEELRDIRQLLSWGRQSKYLWVNMGIESASTELVARHCRGKFGPFAGREWSEMVLESADLMQQAGFFPVYSLILGLPGETAGDVEQTQRLVNRLSSMQAVIFPIFYEPIDPAGRQEGQAFTLAKVRPEHLELFRSCYEINFRLVPRLFWDNQACAGVGWTKRTLVQMLGKGEVHLWRRRFARIQRGLKHNAQ